VCAGLDNAERQKREEGRREVYKHAVKALFPGGPVGTLKGGFYTHRDARRHMLKREGELKARFGIVLYVGGDR
jgi:hypothetical protein